MTTQELIASLTLSRTGLQLNLEGIDDELAVRSPGGGANTVNWIVGHLLHYRNAALQQLGAEPVWQNERLASYTGSEHASWDASTAVALSDLVAALDTSQERLTAAISALSAADLERTVGKRSLAQYLSFLQFHETYHAGQLGILRRLLGLPGVIKAPGTPRPA